MVSPGGCSRGLWKNCWLKGWGLGIGHLGAAGSCVGSSEEGWALFKESNSWDILHPFHWSGVWKFGWKSLDFGCFPSGMFGEQRSSLGQVTRPWFFVFFWSVRGLEKLLVWSTFSISVIFQDSSWKQPHHCNRNGKKIHFSCTFLLWYFLLSTD